MQKDIKMYDTKRTNNEYEICLAIDTGKNEEVVLGKANEEDYVTWICVNGLHTVVSSLIQSSLPLCSVLPDSKTAR